MQATRRRILDLLQTKSPLSVEELAISLNMTKANIRHHLRRLEGDGYLIKVGKKTSQGRGRKTNLYAATYKVGQEDLERLARALWALHFGESTSRERGKRQKSLARRLIGPYRSTSTDAPLTQKLYETIHILNTIGYEAHWEAHADSPHLILAQCPFLAIYDKQPDLCELDTCVLETLLEMDVEQYAHREKYAAKGSSCRFRIH